MKRTSTLLACAGGAVLAAATQVRHPEVPAAAAATEVPGHEHVVERDGQKLYLWERCQPGVEREVAKSGRVVLFLHGATWSGRPDFDLEIRDYSTLAHFARAGWDAFCLDVQGYGKSDDPVGDNWCEAQDAARDVLAAVDYLRRVRGVERVHLIGWSWGSQVAGLFAERHPARVARLVSFGSRWQPLEEAPPPPTDRFRTNTADGAASDFVPGCYEDDVVAAYVEAAMAADGASPNGCLLDYFVNLPVQDPTKISVPTMVLLGEHEAATKLDDQLAFFAALPNPDKRFVILPGGGHAIHLEKPRARWWSAVLEFLEG